MNEVILEASSTTPHVHLHPGEGRIVMEGACYPEDAFSFFEPVFHWIDLFAESTGGPLETIIRLDYFNTSSSKCLLDLIRRLDQMSRNGRRVTIRWQYVEDDEDIRETGEELGEGLNASFTLEPY